MCIIEYIIGIKFNEVFIPYEHVLMQFIYKNNKDSIEIIFALTN